MYWSLCIYIYRFLYMYMYSACICWRLVHLTCVFALFDEVTRGGVGWGGLGWHNSIQVYLHTYLMLRYRPLFLHLHTYLMLRYRPLLLHLYTYRGRASPGDEIAPGEGTWDGKSWKIIACSIYWSVVSTPLNNISQLGWWFPNIWKNKKCSKPPTRYFIN